jgi:hypothetical protein
MSESDGQKYLDAHPAQRIWEFLTIDDRDLCTDADLDRLRLIPELLSISLLSDQISDAGVARLRLLRAPDRLAIYSKTITDACLLDIAELKSLRSLDLQKSPQISKGAFEAAIRKLPSLARVYPPCKES